MISSSQSWVCFQIGARQHYANPRTLNRVGLLAAFVTDAWIPPSSLTSKITKLVDNSGLQRLRQRYHPDLDGIYIHSFTASLVRFELEQRSKGVAGWELIIARNNWFQRKAVQALDAMSSRLAKLNVRPTILSFSYAALEIFRYAKLQGWRTILEQIDPGLYGERIIAKEHAIHTEYTSAWRPAPQEYWDDWFEECSLADHILVNSPWTSKSLAQVGIAHSKISLTPLYYETPKVAQEFTREYPSIFTLKRPLRVLFLGLLGLGKGVGALLETANLLRDEPVEFWLVGPSEIDLSAITNSNLKIRWIGPITRAETAEYYKSADVFLFPTLSDGFGLTQLEAQAWKLPVIASQFCGQVVKNGENGIVLREVSGEAIAESLRYCLAHTQQLKAFSQESNVESTYGLSHLEPLLQFVQDHE